MYWFKKKKTNKKRLTKLERATDPRYLRKQVEAELDAITSMIVRVRANWTCKKCGRRYDPEIDEKTNLPKQQLISWSHFFGRGSSSKGVRWDLDNGDALCIYCHQQVENNKTNTVGQFNYRQFKIDQLGQDRFDILEFKAKSVTKYTLFDLQMMLEEYKKILYEDYNLIWIWKK